MPKKGEGCVPHIEVPQACNSLAEGFFTVYISIFLPGDGPSLLQFKGFTCKTKTKPSERLEIFKNREKSSCFPL